MKLHSKIIETPNDESHPVTYPMGNPVKQRENGLSLL